MKKKRCINARFDDCLINYNWELTTNAVYGISTGLFAAENNEWVIESELYELQHDLRKNRWAKISQ